MISNVITFTSANGSKLCFEDSGLIRCQNHVIGEFNTYDIDVLKMMRGQIVILRDEIRSHKYRIVFDYKNNTWKMFSYRNYSKGRINVLKAKGKIRFTKYNAAGRNQFFSFI